MTQKYNSALFLSVEAVCCPCKCASASCNPVYLHPLALCTSLEEQEPEGRLVQVQPHSDKERAMSVQETTFIAEISYLASPFHSFSSYPVKPPPFVKML